MRSQSHFSQLQYSIPTTVCNSGLTAPVWVPSMGYNSSGKDCSSVSPKSCQKSYFSKGSCLHGPTGCFRSLLQHRLLSTESQPPLGIQLGFCTGCRWRPASSWTSMGCNTHKLPYHGLHHGLQSNLCSRSTSFPSFCTLGSAGLFLSHSHLCPWAAIV